MLATGFTRTRAHALAGAALLLLYWALLTLVPVPGSGPGVLEPGKDLGAYIDRIVFGTRHLWAESRTWDPEGLLSTIPAIATVLAGTLAGQWIRSSREPAAKAAGLFVAGNAGLVLGLIWNAAFPINKNLWTSSYVVFAAGMACHVLALCSWLIDIQGRRRWATPFLVYGTNAIAAFFLSSLFARVLNLITVPGPGGEERLALKAYLYRTLYASWLAPKNASLAFALTYVLFWLAVLSVLYRRRIFIKV